MNRLTRLIALGATILALSAPAADWTAPVDVTLEGKRCLSYRARLDGVYLVVEAAIEPGWHTFTIDNERRAREKLAGKQSLGIDQPTQITLSEALEVAGPWLQSEPKDFSKPELRWFSWGFENRALFAAKVRRTGAGPARIAIRGQACTETSCKNIDVALAMPLPPAAQDSQAPGIDLTKLVQVR